MLVLLSTTKQASDSLVASAEQFKPSPARGGRSVSGLCCVKSFKVFVCDKQGVGEYLIAVTKQEKASSNSHKNSSEKKTPIYFTPKYNPGVKILYLGWPSKTVVWVVANVFQFLMNFFRVRKDLPFFLVFFFSSSFVCSSWCDCCCCCCCNCSCICSCSCC